MEAATARLEAAVERGERIAIFGDYDVDGAPARRCLRISAACGCETIVHIPDRVTEGYGPNVEAMRELRGAGREPRRHRRLRRDQPRALRRSAAARARRHRLRSSSGAGALARARGARRSQPAGRSLRTGLSLRRRASSIMALVALQPRAARRRLLDRPDGARPHRRARSRGAGDRRRRRAADRPQPRLRRPGLDGDARAASVPVWRRCSTSRAPTGRRAPITSAFSSVRASMRAGASATPRSARGC